MADEKILESACETSAPLYDDEAEQAKFLAERQRQIELDKAKRKTKTEIIIQTSVEQTNTEKKEEE